MGLDFLFKIIIEAGVIILGGLGIFLIHKSIPVIENLKKKDTLHIIDTITNLAVQYAEKNYTGKAGLTKQKAAIQYATKWLSDKGIQVSEDEIQAAIQDGYNKIITNLPNKNPLKDTETVTPEIMVQKTDVPDIK